MFTVSRNSMLPLALVVGIGLAALQGKTAEEGVPTPAKRSPSQLPQAKAEQQQSESVKQAQSDSKPEPAAFKYSVAKWDLQTIQGGYVTLAPGEDSFWIFTEDHLSEHGFPGLKKKRTIKIPEISDDDLKMGARILFADPKTIVLTFYSKLLVIDLATDQIAREIKLEADENGHHPSGGPWVMLDDNHILGYDEYCFNIRTGKAIKWPVKFGIMRFVPPRPIAKGAYYTQLNTKPEANASDTAPCKFRVVIEVSQVESGKPPLVVPTNFRAGTNLFTERVFPDMRVVIAKNRYLIWSAKWPKICEPKVADLEQQFSFDLKTGKYLNILGSDTYTLNNSWGLELDQSGEILTFINNDDKIILVDVENKTILASIPISKFKPENSRLDDYAHQLSCRYSRKHNAILYGCKYLHEVILLSPRP